MSRLFLMIFMPMVAIATVGCTKETPQESLKVMSFNIRYDNPDDGVNVWENRKELVLKQITDHNCDVIGLQEVLKSQKEYLKANLPQYQFYGVGRIDGIDQGEHSLVLVKKDRFETVSSGYFWISETPEKIGSKGWDGACERIATWMVIKDIASNKELFMLNVHLDHVGSEAQNEGCKLILQRAKEYAGDAPIVLTGDFNMTPDNEAIVTLLNDGRVVDSRSATINTEGPQWTFSSFEDMPIEKRPIIDYIFTDKGMEVISHRVLPNMVDSQHISDHCPIIADIKL